MPFMLLDLGDRVGHLSASAFVTLVPGVVAGMEEVTLP